MKISEIRGEYAIDVLADLLDPITEIASDPVVREFILKNDRMGTIKVVLKNHKKQVLSILAMLDGEDVETYKPSLAEIPMKILEFFNDPVFAPFFASQGQKQAGTRSGSATENTVEAEAK